MNDMMVFVDFVIVNDNDFFVKFIFGEDMIVVYKCVMKVKYVNDWRGNMLFLFVFFVFDFVIVFFVLVVILLEYKIKEINVNNYLVEMREF